MGHIRNASSLVCDYSANVSTSNFVLVVVIALMLIKLFHQSCSISRLTYKVESLSATIALHDKDLRDEKNLDSITDFNHAARV